MTALDQGGWLAVGAEVEGGRSEVRPGEPLISIIIACKNAAPTIEMCFTSIFEQTSAGWELIVVDGGSSDGSAAIIERHEAKLAWWLSEPDNGIASAWNKAIPHARGSWLMFLGAHDRLASPTVVADVIACLEVAGEQRVAYGTLRVVDHDDNLGGTVGWPWDEVKTVFTTGMFLPHAATFHHRSLFTANGLFDEHLVVAADYEFLLREVLRRQPLYMPGVRVALMRAGAISSQRRYAALLALELYQTHRRHGLKPYPERTTASYRRPRLRVLLVRLLGVGATERIVSVYRILAGRPRHGPALTSAEEIAIRSSWVASNAQLGASAGPATDRGIGGDG